MNLERLRWGDWIAAIAGLDLILVTFRGWYKVTGTGAYVNAWDSLDNGRYLLIATGIVGILLLLLKATDAQMSFPPGWLAAVVGFACTVYVAYRLATPPADVLDAASGIFFGLAGALGVTIGGLLSARDDSAAAPATSLPDEHVSANGNAGGMPAEPVGALGGPAGGGQTWSPAPPVPSSTGWSPAAPAAAVPPATAAGAAVGGERGVQPGDHVVLTAGGTRYPAGTVAEVVEAFGGGALVEVKAPDGVGERFEVPDSAYERAPAPGAGGQGGGGSWSPAMPAPASEDWGFDEPGGAPGAGAPGAAGTEPAAEAPAEKKVPWWKREIGGGGKKKAEAAAAAGAAGAVAAGAAVAASHRDDDEGEQKPGFFKRVFGGGSKAEALEGEPTPATDAGGIATTAESDTAVDEPAPAAAHDEPGTTPGPEDVTGSSVISAAPDPTATEPEPAAAAEPTPEAGGETDAPEHGSGAGSAAAAGAGAAAGAIGGAAAASAAHHEAEPAASEPAAQEAATPSEPEPASPAAPEAEAAPEPEAPGPEAPGGPAASEPPASEPEPSSAAPAADAQPEPDAPAADAGNGGSAAPIAEAGAAGAAGGAAAAGAAGDDEPKPTRKRSSGSRKVPKEALAAAGGGDQPKVGDEVQLKVGGGKFDAGTRGTVVDVFSAGVIVELNDEQGRTERLDLPFEAIGPADS